MFARPTVLRASARKITLPPPRDIVVEFHRADPPSEGLAVSGPATTTGSAPDGVPSSQPDQPAMRIHVQ